MTFQPGMSVDEVHRALQRVMTESFGAERLEEAAGRLQRTAEWIARILAEPLDLQSAPPDQSGIDGREAMS